MFNSFETASAMEFLLTLISCDKQVVLFGIKEKMESIYSFTAAVRRFHYHRKFWKPIENEKLNCLYKDNNPYNRFVIKTVTSNGEIVGHLSREI